MNSFDVRAALASLRASAEGEMLGPLADWCEELGMTGAAAGLRSAEIGPRVRALASLEGVYGDTDDAGAEPLTHHRIALPFPEVYVGATEIGRVRISPMRPVRFRRLVVTSGRPLSVVSVQVGYEHLLDSMEPVDGSLFGPNTRIAFDVPLDPGRTIEVAVLGGRMTGMSTTCRAVALCDPIEYPSWDPIRDGRTAGPPWLPAHLVAAGPPPSEHDYQRWEEMGLPPLPYPPGYLGLRQR